MINFFENIFKQELVITINELNKTDFISSLTNYVSNFYTTKKTLGSSAIVMIALVLPLYKYTNQFIPKLMQKFFPNDLAFIVYCAILILIVGVPAIVWYNMDMKVRRTKINTLETLNYCVQNYFENGAKQITITINFNIENLKEKEGVIDNDIYNFIKLNTAIDTVTYDTTLYLSSKFTSTYGRMPAKQRSGTITKMNYSLHIETICTVPKTEEKRKEFEKTGNNIQYKFTETPIALIYNFKTDVTSTNSVSKPLIKTYFDDFLLTND